MRNICNVKNLWCLTNLFFAWLALRFRERDKCSNSRAEWMETTKTTQSEVSVCGCIRNEVRQQERKGRKVWQFSTFTEARATPTPEAIFGASRNRKWAKGQEELKNKKNFDPLLWSLTLKLALLPKVVFYSIIYHVISILIVWVCIFRTN